LPRSWGTGTWSGAWRRWRPCPGASCRGTCASCATTWSALAAAEGQGPILAEHLDLGREARGQAREAAAAGPTTVDLAGKSMEQIEDEVLLKVYTLNGRNAIATGRALGLDEKTIRRRIAKMEER